MSWALLLWAFTPWHLYSCSLYLSLYISFKMLRRIYLSIRAPSVADHFLYSLACGMRCRLLLGFKWSSVTEKLVVTLRDVAMNKSSFHEPGENLYSIVCLFYITQPKYRKLTEASDIWQSDLKWLYIWSWANLQHIKLF